MCAVGLYRNVGKATVIPKILTSLRIGVAIGVFVD
jgi:hypothetical protein